MRLLSVMVFLAARSVLLCNSLHSLSRTSRALVLLVSVTYTSGPLHASVQTAVNALTYNIPTHVAVQTGVNALTYVSGLRPRAGPVVHWC